MKLRLKIKTFYKAMLGWLGLNLLAGGTFGYLQTKDNSTIKKDEITKTIQEGRIDDSYTSIQDSPSSIVVVPSKSGKNDFVIKLAASGTAMSGSLTVSSLEDGEITFPPM